MGHENSIGYYAFQLFSVNRTLFYPFFNFLIQHDIGFGIEICIFFFEFKFSDPFSESSTSFAKAPYFPGPDSR
jgi:hypothetical protein